MLQQQMGIIFGSNGRSECIANDVFFHDAWYSVCLSISFKTLRATQNGLHFDEDILVQGYCVHIQLLCVVLCHKCDANNLI